MQSVLRAAAVYAFLMVVFRLAGKRTLSEATTFDFMLLLIISEATQNAMIGDDYSLTNGVLVILTLVGLDVALSLLKQRWPVIDRLVEGSPLVLVADGRPIPGRLRRARVDESDILAAARSSRGLERMDQIQYAILESSGGISIIPRP